MIQWAKFVPKAKMIGSKLGSKAKFYASQGASKMGLGVKERFNLSMKYQKAKKKLSNKAFDIKTKGKALASQAKSSGMAGMSKAKAFGIKQKAKFDKLSPQNKILAGTAVVGLGVGIPVKGAAFYYGAREGAALVEKRKQKKNVKKNRKTS
jgi:hypothetical protein